MYALVNEAGECYREPCPCNGVCCSGDSIITYFDTKENAQNNRPSKKWKAVKTRGIIG